MPPTLFPELYAPRPGDLTDAEAWATPAPQQRRPPPEFAPRPSLTIPPTAINPVLLQAVNQAAAPGGGWAQADMRNAVGSMAPYLAAHGGGRGAAPRPAQPPTGLFPELTGSPGHLPSRDLTDEEAWGHTAQLPGQPGATHFGLDNNLIPDQGLGFKVGLERPWINAAVWGEDAVPAFADLDRRMGWQTGKDMQAGLAKDISDAA
jgi:hypothetical protein